MIFRRSRKNPPPAPPPRAESTVTVEDLLQFKKHAEQPSPEFWNDFEHQLKKRQLAAAIQERRPAWWSVLPRIALTIPASATAALAIGFIVWRNTTPPPQPAADTLAHQPLPTASDIAAVANPAPDTNANTPFTASAPARENLQTAVIAAIEQPARPTAAEAAATQPVAPEHLETARNAFASLATIRPHRADPAVNFFNVNAKQQTIKSTSTAALFSEPVVIDHELIAALPASTTTSNPTINTAASTPAKPEDPADPRRERLLTYIDNTIPVAAASTDSPRIVRLRDRVTSRFDDKALSDSISRVATTGDTFTIKF